MRNLNFQARAAFVGPNALRKEAEPLLEFLNRVDDLVEIRPVAAVEFGMEQFAIGADLEGAPARGNQRKRFDAVAKLESFSRQTDGFRRVVSNYAIFDRDLGLHRTSSFPRMKLSARFQWSRVAAPIPLTESADSTSLHFPA